MARMKINVAGGELTLEFADTKDLEEQLKKIDLLKIEMMLGDKKEGVSFENRAKTAPLAEIPRGAEDLGTVNLLKISEGGQDAMKLAVFLAANGLARDEIKKITKITILS
ncbi:MAG TPA: hypothetical protein VJ792_08760 [Candidatus Nitrosotalea sp.]|nr:hypothetical protein [Candidatus Nitrosotalea sp.]